MANLPSCPIVGVARQQDLAAKTDQIKEWWFRTDVHPSSAAFTLVKLRLRELTANSPLTTPERLRQLTPDQVDELWETFLYAQLLPSTGPV